MGTKNAHRQTIKEIVADLEQAPASPPEPVLIEPGKYSGDTLYDPDGHALVETADDDLTPEQTRAAVLDGARLAWDDCGCGGYCNAIEWPAPTDLRREAERAAPRFRKNTGAHVQRLAGNGGDVLLAVGGVRWGDLLH